MDQVDGATRTGTAEGGPARTAVAWVTAVVLLAEAFGVILLCLTLGAVVDNQSMSLAGIDPDLVVNSTYVLAVVAGLLLVLCAVVALLCALRHSGPGRAGRVLLIVAAVVHGVLAAATLALVGWPVFVALLVVLALIVWLLVSAERRERPAPGDVTAPRASTAG